MIGKTEFIKLIIEYREQEERINNLCKVFSKSYEDSIIDWGVKIPLETPDDLFVLIESYRK